MFDGPSSELHAVVDAESVEQLGDVIGDRSRRDYQLLGDMPVGVAAGDQRDDLLLAARELAQSTVP